MHGFATVVATNDDAHDPPLSPRARLDATRSFVAEVPPRRLISDVLDEARWCGSARNRQPWQLFAISSPGTRQALARCAPYGGHLATAPWVVVIGLDHAVGGKDTELDGGRLVETILRACTRRGLGSCPVTFFPDAAVSDVRAIVRAEPRWTTRTGVAIGYPGPPSVGRRAIPGGRRTLDDVVCWEQPAAIPRG